MVARRLLVAGLIATIVGIFLPWSYRGDFVRVSEAGIRVFPVYLYSEHARWLVPGIEDHGGVLILILSVALAIVFVVLPKLAERLRRWTAPGAAVLLLLSLLQPMYFISESAKRKATTATPSVGIGLLLVILGSALVMVAWWQVVLNSQIQYELKR